MRLKHVKGAEETVASHPSVIHEPEKNLGRWKELRDGERAAELIVEIGSGKGRFIMDLAKKNPNSQCIGIEMYSSVLVRALEKLEQLPPEEQNVFFLNINGEHIETVFAPGEIDRIYLNFSDPWPKERHAKRRLTSRRFLARYEKVLAPHGVVEFKTDNRDLFDFSLEEAAECGWEVLSFTYDLHADEKLCEGNIMTEYEEKFSSEGKPICKVVMRPARKEDDQTGL